MKNLTILICLVLISGCEKYYPEASTYPKLKGEYIYYSYESWENGLYEQSRLEIWQFDHSTKANHYICAWSYTKDGWINATKEGNWYDTEWKVEYSLFYERLWDNEFDDWREYQFNFDSYNDRFILDNKLFEKNE